jgi:type IV secretory pathway component VirB8
VEFPANFSVVRQTNTQDTYLVSFRYVCSYGDLGDQQYEQSYKLRVRLKSSAGNAVRWAERMENPLGFQVSGYDVIGKDNQVLDADPLNWTAKE